MTAQRTTGPPMDPTTDLADQQQLDLTRRQGDAYGRAVQHMPSASPTPADSNAPATTSSALPSGDENLHIEAIVRDASDGRFVPGCTVTVTVIDGDGKEVGAHEQPLLWHPMLYHYGRNWTVPGDGTYALRIHVAPPRFMRHDKTTATASPR